VQTEQTRLRNFFLRKFDMTATTESAAAELLQKISQAPEVRALLAAETARQSEAARKARIDCLRRYRDALAEQTAAQSNFEKAQAAKAAYEKKVSPTLNALRTDVHLAEVRCADAGRAASAAIRELNACHGNAACRNLSARLEFEAIEATRQLGVERTAGRRWVSDEDARPVLFGVPDRNLQARITAFEKYIETLNGLRGELEVLVESERAPQEIANETARIEAAASASRATTKIKRVA